MTKAQGVRHGMVQSRVNFTLKTTSRLRLRWASQPSILLIRSCGLQHASRAATQGHVSERGGASAHGWWPAGRAA
jgi:hypothetical protein